MTRMSTRLFAVLAALILASCALSAASADEGWTCEVCLTAGNTGNFCTECGAAKRDNSGPWNCASCGTEGNTGNFCPVCGAVRPSLGVPNQAAVPGTEPEATMPPTAPPTAPPTPEPAPDPTPTPAPAAVLNDSVSFSNGLTTISWTGSGDYYVMMTAVNGSSDQHTWRIGESSFGSVQTGYMMPGKTYSVRLVGTDFLTVDEKVYTLPAVGNFEDGKLKHTSVKVTTEMRVRAAGASNDRAKKVSGLSAAKIVAAIDNKNEAYGFKYHMKMPRLAKARSFYVQVFMESPDGYLDSLVVGDVNFDRVNNGYQTLWWNFLADDYFEGMKDTLGTVPAGTYTVTMFWDGMFMNETSVKVGP